MLLPSEKPIQALHRKFASAIGKGDALVYFTTKGFCDDRGDVPIASGVLCTVSSYPLRLISISVSSFGLRLWSPPRSRYPRGANIARNLAFD
jgi:hypothetical protein